LVIKRYVISVEKDGIIEIYMVEYENGRIPNPGGFRAKKSISTIEKPREKLALLEQCKNKTVGTIGPQLEKTGVNVGKTYSGGAPQYEF